MSVPERLPAYWSIALPAAGLGAAPVARVVHGVPLVLFRDATGAPAALLDRCPHRNVALSGGRVAGGALRCPYHGWAFDGAGACVAVPGACGPIAAAGARAFAAVEDQGFVWVGDAPAGAPYRFPHRGEAGWVGFTAAIAARGSLADAAENFLDGTHTHTVHAGLIRREGVRREVLAEVARAADRVEVAYRDDRTMSGLVRAVLGRGVTRLDVFARFVLPGVAELEYRTDGVRGLVLSLALTPGAPGELSGHLVAAFRGAPGWLGTAVARPLFLWAARQDAAILRAQADGVARFGGPRYAYTELDLVRPHLDVLLRRLEADGLPPGPGAIEARREVRLSL